MTVHAPTAPIAPPQVRVRSTIVAPASRRVGTVPQRLSVLVAGGLALLLGLYTGLARGGIEHRFVGADLHAILMVLGFLGTLIALERAVALGVSWGYLAPAASVAAVAALPFARMLAGVLFVVAGGVTCCTYIALLRRRVAHHLLIMALGAASWVAAAALWVVGAGPVRITPLLAAFLVLTIVGERLELSRLTGPGPASRRRFLGAVGTFALGTAITAAWRPTGLVVAGIALVAQAIWLARHDVARITVRRPGSPRFSAICVLVGYAWLAVSGLLWVAIGAGASGPLLHDALVHALFLGFVLSMVMGHAPIIVPAVLRGPLRFTRATYAPLLLLHASVAVRIAADLAGSFTWREVALHGNVAALLVFVLVTAVTKVRSREPADVRGRSATRGSASATAATGRWAR